MNDSKRDLGVLVVDDQSLVLDGFTRIVNAQPDMHAVGTARNGKEAIDRVRVLKPDVVLMDIRMPLLDGIEATRTIVNEQINPTTRILGLTTYDTDAYAIRMLKAGAIGFILKDSSSMRSARPITGHSPPRRAQGNACWPDSQQRSRKRLRAPEH